MTKHWEALAEHGWFALSEEVQMALIEDGFHPGPMGGCGRRIKGGTCGMHGYCIRCWSDRRAEDEARAARERLDEKYFPDPGQNKP